MISFSCVDRFRDRPHTTKNATWPAEASIHVSCSSMSFSKMKQTSSSHFPHWAPCGRKLESQNVIIAKASNSIDWPAKPVKQKFRTWAC